MTANERLEREERNHRMTKAEEAFIKDAGPRWHKALAAAAMHIRSDRRFVGLDKIREPAIHRAALLALGGEFPSPALARIAEESKYQDGFMKSLDALIDEAAKLAREAAARKALA